MRRLADLLSRFTAPRRSPVAGKPARRRRALCLEQLEDRRMMSAVSWDGGGGDANWHNALNWSDDALPGASDDVAIGGTVDVSDGDVTVGSLSLYNGTLSGASDLTVNGLFTWQGGTLTGSSELNANGGMLIQGDAYFGGQPKFLDGRTLNNAGAAVWKEGYVTAYNGAIINNLAGATFDVQSARDLNYEFYFGGGGVGARATFNNAGTFRKTGDTPAPVADGPGTNLDVIFHNTGTVEVQVGTLMLFDLDRDQGYITAGDFAGAAGTWLNLSGGTLSSDSSIQSAGQVGLNGVSIDGVYDVTDYTSVGEATFTGTILSMGDLYVGGFADFSADNASPIELDSLYLGSGVLTGTSDLTVNGLFTWQGGTLTGSGELNANGGMLIQGDAYFGGQPKFLDGRTLNNAGAAVWVNGYVTAHNGAVINNLAGATFDVQSDRDLNFEIAPLGWGGQGARATFNNAGTFRKTGNTPVGYYDGEGTNLDVIFQNTGTVEAQAGTLSFYHSYTQTSGTTLLNGGAINYIDLQGGSLTGSGPVLGDVFNAGEVSSGFSPGVIEVHGNYSQRASGALVVELAGGMPGDLPSDHDQLDVHGAVALAGGLNVSLINGFSPTPDQTFVIVNNHGSDAVAGIFDGLSEGGIVTGADGSQFRVSYMGGDGNDVTLTYINHPPTANPDDFTTYEDLSVSGNVLANDSDPDAGQTLTVVEVNGSAANVGQNIATDHGTVTLHADGSFDYTPGIGCGAASDSFSYTISDGHGGTATATVHIQFEQYAGVTTVEGILRVGGTAGDDVVTVSGGDLIVNGAAHSLAGVSEVRIWGLGGHDRIDLSGLGVKAFVDGGEGNDVLTGGSAHDVIFGGAGNDTLTGASGDDFLIGGTGQDRIVGSAGNDILVAGDMECGLDLAALRAISQAWSSSRSIVDEAVDDFLEEIVSDGESDQLTGGSGADLFIINWGDKITDFKFGKPRTNKDGDVVIRDGVIAT